MNDEMDTMLDAVEDEGQIDDIIDAPTEEPEDEPELAYDEDGDVTIPEDDEDVDDAAEDEPSEDEEADDDSAEDTPEKEEAPVKEEPAPAPDAQHLENERLKKQIAERDRLIRDALKMLGEDENAGAARLEEVIAESEGDSVEAYRQKRDEELKTEEAKRLIRQQAFEEKARADLKEVQEAFPDTKAYGSVFDLPNFAKFGQFRDLGLTPKEAYIAANPDAVMSSVASATKRQSLNDTKQHLRSSVPKGSKDTSAHIPRSELSQFREMFPDASDKEINELYKRATKK